MTQTPPPPPPPPPALPPTASQAPPTDQPVDTGPRVGRDEVRDLGRLRRTSGVERTIGGVASGLGRHLDIDPVILKVGFVVLAFFGGAGLVLYLALWLLLPEDRSTSAPLGLDDRSRGIGVVIAGGVAALVLLGSSVGDGWFSLPVVLLALGVLAVAIQLGKRRQGVPDGPGSPGPQPPAPWSPPGSGTTTTAWAGSTGYAPTSPYAAPAAPGTSWAAPTYAAPPAPAPRPRKPGPVLFWFTLALCALGLGVLGTVDLAGVDVPGSAYPALVVGLSGLVLLVSAFWGRGGGLIALGLLAAVALAGSAVAERVGDDRGRVVVPTTAAEVRPSYTFDAGRLVLDLRDVTDPAALAGRTVTIAGDVGQVEVVVPDGLPVTATGEVDGPGSVEIFGVVSGGLGSRTSSSAGGEAATTPLDVTDVLTLETTLDVGSIQIRSTP